MRSPNGSVLEVVFALAFDPSSGIVAEGQGDGTVRLWWLLTGAFRKYPGQDDRVTGLDFSPDGRFLATASGNSVVRIWRAGDGAAVAAAEGHDREVMSPLRRATGPGLGQHAPVMGGVRAVAYCPDGSVLASGADDHSVRLWRSPSGEPLRVLRVLRGHAAGVSSLAFSPDGRLLASGGWDGDVRLWACPESRRTAGVPT